jgi:phage FluMu gp28-like protein
LEGLPKNKRDEVIDALCWTYPTWFFEILVEMEGHPLILEPFQIKYLLDDSQFKITNKTRQAGGSVQLALAKFYKAYTNENYRCDIISISLQEAADKIAKIKAFWETIPKAYQIPLEVDNQLSIGWHRGKSKISMINSRAASGTIRGARKEIVFDEFAHIRGAEELLGAALPAIMNGSLGVDIVSTPQGKHNMFGEIWENDINHRGIRPWEMFSRHQFIWLDVHRFVTDYDAVQHEWYNVHNQDMREMQGLIEKYASPTLQAIYHMRSWDYIQQEFCGVFLDDTYSLFPYELLNRVFKPIVGQIEDQVEDVYVEKWSENVGRPIGNDSYLTLGVDFGKSGSSNDKTSMQLLEKTGDGRLKHHFSKNLTRAEFTDMPAQAAEVARIASVFQVNKVMCDGGGLGIGTVPIVDRLLPNIHVESFEFNNQMKEEMVMNLKSLMERDELWLMQSDNELYAEIHDMTATPLPSGKIRYHGEPHDDMFWALALAAKEGTYKHFAMYTLDSLIKGLAV